MARYKWDKQTNTWVKFSDACPRVVKPDSAGPSLAQQVMAGYRRCELRGDRINGAASGIKRIWGGT